MQQEAFTIQSPDDEESLRELDIWLRSRAHSQAAIDAKIAEHSDKALRKILQSYDYIDRLAGILEAHGFGLGSHYWTGEVDLAKDFWAKVSKARVEKERRMNVEEQIKAALPNGMFDHYGWYRLADHFLSGLKHVRTKCSSWKSWRYLLNWAMLHRDKGYRDNPQKFRNTAVFIGQHHYLSAIRTASSPLEKKDIMCAKLWLDKCPRFEQNQHNHWEWDRVITTKYMRMHQLTFDEHGFIIPRTGSFSNSLVEQVLFRRSHAAHETMRMSQEQCRVPMQPMRGPHIDVPPPLDSSNTTASHRSVCPEMPFVQSSSSSIPPGVDTGAYSQSPACNSSPEVEENEAGHDNVGMSEASSTPRGHIEPIPQQAPFDHHPLTPPSSAGGLVRGGWKEYVRMIDDVMSCITRDEGLRHVDDTESVLSYLRNARELCALHDGGEWCIVHR
jgi:hypothetical protein